MNMLRLGIMKTTKSGILITHSPHYRFLHILKERRNIDKARYEMQIDYVCPIHKRMA